MSEKTKILFQTEPGTPVQCIPMMANNPLNLNAGPECIGMIFKTPDRTVVCGGFEMDFYMRGDGWSGANYAPIAMLENYAVAWEGLIATLTDEFVIKESTEWSDETTYECTFTDKMQLLFRSFNEV